MKYLGNYSSHPYHSLAMECHYCQVSWGGCASAAECPQCGRGVDYLRGETSVMTDEVSRKRYGNRYLPEGS